jgi:hypothetical protein
LTPGQIRVWSTQRKSDLETLEQKLGRNVTITIGIRFSQVTPSKVLIV